MVQSKVTYVEENGVSLYIWLQDNVEEADLLQSKLAAELATLQREEDQRVKPGVLILAELSDGQFYRARIIRPCFKKPFHYQCFFFDNGNFGIVPIEKIYKLPLGLNLRAYSQQARCHLLDGIVAKAADKWTENELAMLSLRLVGKLFFKKDVGLCGPLPVTELHDLIDDVNIVDSLVLAGVGRRESANGQWTSYIPPNHRLISGQVLEVQVVRAESATDVIAAVDPNFYGITLEQIMHATFEAPKKQLSVAMAHMLCLARFEMSPEEISFYRAEILSVEPTGNVHILLLDIGSKVVLSIDCLFTLIPELLSLPLLTFHMCVGGLGFATEETSQSELLNILYLQNKSVKLKILHSIGPNFYSVAIDQLGLIQRSPLPFRLLPFMGPWPFEIFLNKSLSSRPFIEPIQPAVIHSSLQTFDNTMAGFLSYMCANPMIRLPSNAIETGVFCIVLENLDFPYPLRCVILASISNSRCLVYEIDTGCQSIRDLDQLFVAPPWALSEPAFCVPVIVPNSKNKLFSSNINLIQCRYVQREPVGTPAGIVILEEQVHSISHHVSEVIIPVGDETSSELTDSQTENEQECPYFTDAQSSINEAEQFLTYADGDSKTNAEINVVEVTWSTADDTELSINKVNNGNSCEDCAQTDQKSDVTLKVIPSCNIESAEELDSDSSGDDGKTEMTDYGEEDDSEMWESQRESANNLLGVGERWRAFEQQHSRPARMLSENSRANEQTSPICPLKIRVMASLSRSDSAMHFGLPEPLSVGEHLLHVSRILGDVKSTRKFWAQDRENPAFFNRYEMILRELEDSNHLSSIDEHSFLNVGFCCVAVSNTDSKARRANIIECRDSDNFKVFYIDEGYFETCHRDNLRRCPFSIIDIPQLSYECHLTDSCGKNAPEILSSESKIRVIVESFEESTDRCVVKLLCPTMRDLQPAQPITKARFAFEITHIAGPNDFFVKALPLCGEYDKDDCAYRVMTENLQKESTAIFSASPQDFPDFPDSSVGTLVLYYSYSSTLPKRAVILGVESSQCLIQMIDTGNVITRDVHELKILPRHEYYLLPPRVAHVSLSNISEMARPITEEDVFHRIILQVDSVEMDGLFLPHCSARCLDERFLSDNSNEPTTEDSAPPLLSNSQSLPPCQHDLSKHTHSVTVCYFESADKDFYVHMKNDELAVSEIDDTLSLVSKNIDGENLLRVIEHPRVGQICAGRFPQETGELYRAEVKQLNPLTVYYVDYGNSELVSEVFEIPAHEPRLWGPPLAHRCRLSQSPFPDCIEMYSNVNLYFAERFVDDGQTVYSCELRVPSLEIKFPPYPEIAAQGNFKVARIDGETIWILNDPDELDLINIEDKLLNINYSQLKPLAVDEIGESEGKFLLMSTANEDAYRVEILKVDAASISILLIDHGLEQIFLVKEIIAKTATFFDIPSSDLIKIPRIAFPAKVSAESKDVMQRLHPEDFTFLSFYIEFDDNSVGKSEPPFFVKKLTPLEGRTSTTTPGVRNPHSAALGSAFIFPSPVVEGKPHKNSQVAQHSINQTPNAPESGFMENAFDADIDSPFESPSAKPNNSLLKHAFVDGARFKAICVHNYGPKEGENSDISVFNDESRLFDFEAITAALSDITRLAPLNAHDVTIGSVVAARFPEDLAWYRAIVLTKPISNNSGPSVYFMDYGNTCTILSCSAEDIRLLPPSLSPDRIKPLAITVRPVKDNIEIIFEIDQTYDLEVISSNTFLSGALAAACRIPVLVARVIDPTNTVDAREVESGMLDCDGDEDGGGEDTVGPKVTYNSSTLRQFKQLAATANLSIATLENMIQARILRLSSINDNDNQFEYFLHDNRSQKAACSENSAKRHQGGAYSVRPFIMTPAPKSAFDAKVSWIDDEAIFVQFANEESQTKLERIEAVAQKLGHMGTRVDRKQVIGLLHQPCISCWDNWWSRGVIRSVFSGSEDPEVEVFFVDYGNMSRVPVTEIVLLRSDLESQDHRELLDTPALALPILNDPRFQVAKGQSVKVCLENRLVPCPPYGAKSINAILH